MSILIKGIDMPTGCYSWNSQDCPCYDNEFNRCQVKDVQLAWGIEPDERPEWCPLIEVKAPHGRLIDEDELKNTFKFSEDAEYARWTLAGVLMDIEDTDEVIESED